MTSPCSPVNFYLDHNAAKPQPFPNPKAARKNRTSEGEGQAF